MDIKKIPKFLIFCFVGGVATLIDFVIFNLFAYILGSGFLMPQISRILGILISMVWNFTMNRNITFRVREEKIKYKLPKWIIVYGITALINLAIFSLVISQIGNTLLGRNIAFVSGTAVSISLNFLGSKFWTFRRRN